MGVVVRRYIDFLIIIITYLYTPFELTFFSWQDPYFLDHFLKVFCSCLCYFCAI